MGEIIKSTAFWQNFFTFLGVFTTAIFALIATNLKMRKDQMQTGKVQAEAELINERDAMDFSGFFTKWDDTNFEIEALMNTTNVDTFMLFRAWNGSATPRWTTAIFQMRRGIHAPVNYVHYELDNDYAKRLLEIKEKRSLTVITKDLAPSTIKEMYEIDGIVMAAWFYIEFKAGINNTSASNSYCSFGTHEGVIPPETVRRCQLIANRLRDIASAFEDSKSQAPSP